MFRGALLIALLGCAGGVDAQEHPFAGHWTANIGKSRLSPSYPFQSGTLDVSVAADTITMASVVINAGKEQRAAETFRTDGTETSGTINRDVRLVAKFLDPHVLATIAKKGGAVLALVTYEVSADGKTMFVRSSGSVEHVVVFERR